MMEFETLYAIDMNLGVTGTELKRWADAEIAREREKPAPNREDVEEQAEQDRLRLEGEERVLKLKIELQEKTGSTQGASTDAIAGQSLSRASPDVLNPHKLIPPFNEKRDDVDAYLKRLEPEDNEAGLQYATFDCLRDAMIAQQFVASCCASVLIFLKERNCRTLDSLAKNPDRFTEAQNFTTLGKEKAPQAGPLASAYSATRLAITLHSAGPERRKKILQDTDGSAEVAKEHIPRNKKMDKRYVC
ncbi:hypothetical protein HPB52_014242 [Rhipicephalus sanguineus]|uniref:Uncharacterized protein n=1 Tax=Rhipicephalus sanguineus TaxID=34632 RepID=A0A9D4PLM6_RHISA|nr:hypothetical protein HPB52_014242 [Rhipicephalus sanguineus]